MAEGAGVPPSVRRPQRKRAARGRRAHNARPSYRREPLGSAEPEASSPRSDGGGLEPGAAGPWEQEQEEQEEQQEEEQEQEDGAWLGVRPAAARKGRGEAETGCVLHQDEPSGASQRWREQREQEDEREMNEEGSRLVPAQGSAGAWSSLDRFLFFLFFNLPLPYAPRN